MPNQTDLGATEVVVIIAIDETMTEEMVETVTETGKGLKS